jgi:quercetin dioxygenase-like cupin family protein
MNITLPHTIENGLGEKIIFKEIIHEPDGDKVVVEAFCQPQSGPIMHVHYKQDEAITVVSGKMSYQFSTEEPKTIGSGETVLFLRNKPHRFWNAGNEILQLSGWVKPANSIIFFLSALYEAQKKGSNGRPEDFDAAYLMTRYKNEYGMPELPSLVKNIMMPLTYRIGKLLGKYKKFEGAPEPL